MHIVDQKVDNQSNSLTLSLLINFQTYKAYSEKGRALKLQKSLKVVRDLSIDPELVDTCRRMIKEIKKGRYEVVLKIIGLTEIAFCTEHGIS